MSVIISECLTCVVDQTVVHSAGDLDQAEHQSSLHYQTGLQLQHPWEIVPSLSINKVRLTPKQKKDKALNGVGIFLFI